MQTLVYFLIWGALFFLMMRFGCGAHVMGRGHGRSDTKLGASSSVGGSNWLPPSKAIDPVCGMTVEPAASKSTVHDGHVFYFCSQNCREKFEASPKSYTGGGQNPPQIMEHSDEHQH